MPAGTIVAAGSLVSPGGAQGPSGPNAVSTDAGNQATFGSDSKLYVPPIPSGVMWDYAGASAPGGWLLCDGSAVSRTTYAALFAAISTTYGTGDGSTTFNLPDARGKVSVGTGQGTGLTNRVIATVGGEENHLLSAAELASHNHTATSTQGAHTHTDSGHSHNTFYTVSASAGSAVTAIAGTTGTAISPGTSAASAVISTVSAGTITTTVNATAAGTNHNNMQPFIVINKIIKT